MAAPLPTLPCPAPCVTIAGLGCCCLPTVLGDEGDEVACSPLGDAAGVDVHDHLHRQACTRPHVDAYRRLRPRPALPRTSLNIPCAPLCAFFARWALSLAPCTAARAADCSGRAWPDPAGGAGADGSFEGRRGSRSVLPSHSRHIGVAMRAPAARRRRFRLEDQLFRLSLPPGPCALRDVIPTAGVPDISARLTAKSRAGDGLHAEAIPGPQRVDHMKNEPALQYRSTIHKFI